METTIGMHGDRPQNLGAVHPGDGFAEPRRVLEVTLSSAPVVLFAVDGEGTLTVSEGKGLEALGLEPGEMVGRSVFEAYRDEPGVVRNLGRALDGETFSSIVEVEGAVFECRYGPLKDPEGAVGGALGVATDVTARRRAERALRDNEERYRTLVETVREGIAHIAPEGGVITYCNRSYAAILGLTPEEVVGRSFFDFLGDGQRAEALRQRELRVEGVDSSYEMAVTAADGARRILSCGGYPLFGRDGTYEGAVQTVADVTERRETEEALRRSEERFRLVAHATGEAIWDNDLLTGEQEWAGATEALFGYRPGGGKTGAWWEDRVHPEDRDRVLRGLDAVLSGGEEAWAEEYRFLRADGSYAHVEDRGHVVRDGRGRPVRMVGAMADVTERNRHEEETRRSEETFRAAFEAAPVGMALVGPDGRWRRVNGKLCDMLGYAREELLGLTPLDVTHPDDRDKDLEHVRRVLADGTETCSLEKRYVRKDGSLLWARLDVSPIRGRSGEPDRFVAAIEDITERKTKELAYESLTPREREVLTLMLGDCSNGEMANRLHLSVATVKTHARHILGKLGVKDRRELLRSYSLGPSSPS